MKHKPLSILLFSLLTILFLVSCSPRAVYTVKSHYSEGKFRNVHEYDPPGFSDFIKWRWENLWKDIPGVDSYQFTLAGENSEFLKGNRNDTTVTWIGHATLLIQMNGKNILTDPQFSQRASPVQWAGPERAVEPGIKMDKLPVIDAVVISHDHYDSLDTASIKRLYNRQGGKNTLFYVPLGLKKWFTDLNIENVKELDWWEMDRELGIEITAVPVQHWSKRSLFSQNDSLWAAWVFEIPDFRFFFGGDSGYTPHFKKIGERFGSFDLAAIPIGAYEPRWFMQAHHISPEQAVQVHLDIRSKKSIGIHWGTFILTDEPLDEPPILLKKELNNRNLPGNDFIVFEHGETRVFNKEGILTALLPTDVGNSNREDIIRD